MTNPTHYSRTLFLFIFGALGFFGCSKKEQVYRLDPAGLQYIQFNANKYFIYKDSASGKIDSVVVSQSEISTETFQDGEQTAIREIYKLHLVRKNMTADSTWLQGQAKADVTNYVKLWDIMGGTNFFVYPAVCICTDLYKVPILTVESKTYQDVIVKEDAFIDSYSLTFYWAPSVGIIKVVKKETPLSTNKRWTHTLVRHN
jgi:hypothetical protein